MRENLDGETFDQDPLYIGLTRPPMLLGVTDVYAVFFMVIEVTIFVGVGGGQGILYSALCAPVFYTFGYVMCTRDPRIFGIWLAKGQFFSRAARRRLYWGGRAYDPY